MVRVPVTSSVPVTGSVAHPAPKSPRLRLPLTLRHDDFTVQVPTVSPPQADTFGQLPPATPPVPVAPLPPFPPAPDGLPDPALHAPMSIPVAVAMARTERAFMGSVSFLEICAAGEILFTKVTTSRVYGTRKQH